MEIINGSNGNNGLYFRDICSQHDRRAKKKNQKTRRKTRRCRSTGIKISAHRGVTGVMSNSIVFESLVNSSILSTIKKKTPLHLAESF